jgi:hypothetical protein
MSGGKQYVAEETYFSPRELAVWLRDHNLEISPNGHDKAAGPPFIRAGKRLLYPMSHLLAWEAARLPSPASDEPSPAA